MNKQPGPFVGPSTPRKPLKCSRVLAAVVIACSIAGCDGSYVNGAFAQDAECSMRVIVRFSTEPDSAWLANIERRSAIKLEPAGAITADLRVFTLRATGSDEECSAALDLLRRDERVRSVDLDERRDLHEVRSSAQREE